MRDMEIDTKALLDAAESQSDWVRTALRRLVEVESPSDDKAAVDAAVGLAADFAEACGGRVKLHKQKHFGNVLEVRFGPTRGGRKPILLLDRKSVV